MIVMESMMDSVTNDDVNEYCRLWREINLQYEEYAKALGTTYSVLLVMSIINSVGETCTQKDICSQSFLPKQTVNLIIKSFLKDGFIKMTELESDRRNKVIRFTKKGKEYVQKYIFRIKDAENRAMKKLSEKDRQQLLESTKSYTTYFKEYMTHHIEELGNGKRS
nr:MarR family winged helix-turn-helix transcriptional regulator [Treponema endosymbiont of Eucomonympha sp.]